MAKSNKGHTEMANKCAKLSGSKKNDDHSRVYGRCILRGENELANKDADNAAEQATSSQENNRKLGELYEVYNSYLKTTQYKDTTDSITKSEFSKKLISSLTEQYFVNNSHWKSKFENWMKERNIACERTIKEHLGGCIKDLGYKDSDIFAKYVQYTSQGHRSPLLFNLTPNTNWPSKPEAFFDNISNNIIKDKIWDDLSKSRFTPNSTGKNSFLNNVTKDNVSRCIRYEYYKKFIEARDKKCIDLIVSGIKNSAKNLKCKFPTYGLPTDNNEIVKLYLQNCDVHKVPFQETFNEINNYTTIIKVKEQDSKFFDSIFEKIAKANASTTITPAASSCPTKPHVVTKPPTPQKNGWMGYISENPMTTAAVGLGALGVGAWAYNKYRRSSSKSRSSGKNKSAKSSDEKSNDDEKNSDNEKSNDDEKSNDVKSNDVKSNESVVTASRKRNSGTKKKK